MEIPSIIKSEPCEYTDSDMDKQITMADAELQQFTSKALQEIEFRKGILHALRQIKLKVAIIVPDKPVTL